MNRLIFLLLLFSTTLVGVSCDKDKCDTGTVILISKSNNPYDLFIDGNFHSRLAGNSRTDVTLTTGPHNIKVVQVSGYVLFPTEKLETVNVIGCFDLNWEFP